MFKTRVTFHLAMFKLPSLKLAFFSLKTLLFFFKTYAVQCRKDEIGTFLDAFLSLYPNMETRKKVNLSE